MIGSRKSAISGKGCVLNDQNDQGMKEMSTPPFPPSPLPSPQALKEAFDDLYPGAVDVSIVDIWTEAAPWPLNRFVPAYQFMAKRPLIWRAFWQYGRFPPARRMTTVSDVERAVCKSGGTALCTRRLLLHSYDSHALVVCMCASCTSTVCTFFCSICVHSSCFFFQVSRIKCNIGPWDKDSSIVQSAYRICSREKMCRVSCYALHQRDVPDI